MAHHVQVLILTSELDFATDRICRNLRNREVDFLRLNREQLPEITFILDPTAPSLVCRYQSEEWTIDNTLRSVWWRQGTFDRTIAQSHSSIEDQMIRTQWGSFMRSMMVFDHAKWFNHPSATYRAEVKAVQLLEAVRIGFCVPRTLLTNDPDADVELRIGSRIALKSIDTLLIRAGNEQLFGYTTLLEWNKVAVPDLRLAPATIQSALTNKLDLRVTVLGDELWCVAIEASGKSIEGDWRLTAKKDLNFRDFALPDSIASKCLDIVRCLGLRYGAIDLALVDSHYWFIEINPTGEWGWLDGAERPIAQSITEQISCPS